MNVPKPPVENLKNLNRDIPKPPPFQLAASRWRRIAKRLPSRPKTPRLKKKRTGGRPRHDDQRCFEGILWLLWNRTAWRALPRRYGTKSTVHRRLMEWDQRGILDRMWLIYLKRMGDRKIILWNERFKRKRLAWPFMVLEGALRANYARLFAAPPRPEEEASFNSR
jgi:transposase